MAIHRAPRPEQHYTQVRNDVLRDERLSYRARGILAAILSRPDHWSASAESLARTGQEGRDAIRTALTELEQAGYLVREKRQDDKGRWSTQAVVYDVPATGNQASVPQPSVSQAVSTNTGQEQPLPTGGGAKPAKPEDQVARAVYDATHGMVNYLGVRTIVARALKVEGSSPERVQEVCLALYGQGRPITLQTVGQALSGGTSGARGPLPTNAAHWSSGGGFQ